MLDQINKEYVAEIEAYREKPVPPCSCADALKLLKRFSGKGFQDRGRFSVLAVKDTEPSPVLRLFQILPFEPDYTFADVLGLLFMCAWISLVLSMGLFALKTNSKQITIDRKGILCESWLRKELISWDEIKQDRGRFSVLAIKDTEPSPVLRF